MERLGYFIAGFTSGWAVRTTVDSSRNLAVNVISRVYGVMDLASRAVGMEREHLEDLLAEARAKYETERARAARTQGSAPTSVGRQDRAA